MGALGVIKMVEYSQQHDAVKDSKLLECRVVDIADLETPLIAVSDSGFGDVVRVVVDADVFNLR
jgi:hypothetical protein